MQEIKIEPHKENAHPFRAVMVALAQEEEVMLPADSPMRTFKALVDITNSTQPSSAGWFMSKTLMGAYIILADNYGGDQYDRMAQRVEEYKKDVTNVCRCAYPGCRGCNHFDPSIYFDTVLQVAPLPTLYIFDTDATIKAARG